MSEVEAPPHRSRLVPALTVATALAATAGVVLELMLTLAQTRSAPAAAHATLRLFSYFTILSNVLVALACALPLAARARAPRAARFFALPRVRGAVALYIAVTAAVYIVMLAPLWHPTGLLRVADALLHYVVPSLYLALWLRTTAAPRPRLAWGDALRWLAFPAAYLAWTLLRGALAHEYPYPFVDVNKLGLVAVLRNSAGLTVIFFVLGLGLVGVDKLAGRALALDPRGGARQP
jgi:hypothetical protein